MKQQLISTSNSVLLCILLTTIVVSELTKIVPPLVNMPSKNAVLAANTERFAREALPISQIYGKRNVFGLEWDQLTTETKFDLAALPAISEFKLPEKSSVAPKEVKDNIIDPLNIALNGIIISSNEESNACIISDSSGQEKMYRVGDAVQDGFIIDIVANGVSLIRPNGQIESFKIADSDGFNTPANPWSRSITKLDESRVIIDHKLLAKSLTSLGQLIEELGIIPLYKGNTFQGFLVTKVEAESLGAALGLEKEDVVTAIFESDLGTIEARIEVYDKILAAEYGLEFTTKLKRKNSDVTLTYKFDKTPTKTKSLAEFLGGTSGNAAQQSDSKDSSAANNKENLNSANLFTKPAEDRQRYTENIGSIRKRLLENATRQRFSQPR